MIDWLVADCRGTRSYHDAGTTRVKENIVSKIVFIYPPKTKSLAEPRKEIVERRSKLLIPCKTTEPRVTSPGGENLII